MPAGTGRRAPLIPPPLGAPLAAGELPPKKVAWLAPWQLLRTGFHVWIETIGSGFVDRREVMAALDRRARPNKPFAGGHVRPGERIDGWVLPADLDHGRLSVDYVADVGDSWEATYAVASLLADADLRAKMGSSAAANIPTLPQGDLLVLGGDLVYPFPARDTYRRRFKAPFADAYPDSGATQRSLVAIPGNHDWYDGLNGFTRALCQSDSIGGWMSGQSRSYFAIKLIAGWWIWGIDIALDTRIDGPQLAYFQNILRSCDDDTWPANEKFDATDRIVLCTAKPAWLEMSRYSDEAYRNLVMFVDTIVDSTKRDVPVILAGDLHHYCHYQCVPTAAHLYPTSPSHLIVSGGGGAYLMGTHFLPTDIDALVRKPSLPESGEEPATLTDPYTLTSSQYPNAAESRRLALGALRLALRPANWPFCLLLGAVYWLLTPDTRGATYKIPWMFSPVDLLRSLWDQPCQISLVWASIVLAICVAFAVGANSRASRVRMALWGAVHALVQVLVALSVSLCMTSIANRLVRVPVFIIVGGLIAGTIVGVYLAISDRYFDLHHNEAFAVQSIIDYRNFLRLVIDPNGTLTIYPIGLRRVPRRWRRRVDPKQTDPLYEPADAVLSPHLIEGPIRIAAKQPE